MQLEFHFALCGAQSVIIAGCYRVISFLPSPPSTHRVFLVKIQQGLAPGASKDREGMGSNSAFDHHGDGALAAQGVHHSKGDCVEVLSSGGESLSSVQRVLDHRFRDGRTIQTLPKHLILHGSVCSLLPSSNLFPPPLKVLSLFPGLHVLVCR